MESKTLDFTGMKIPRDYFIEMEDKKDVKIVGMINIDDD